MNGTGGPSGSKKSVIGYSPNAGNTPRPGPHQSYEQFAVKKPRVKLADPYSLKYFTWKEVRAPQMGLESQIPLPRSGHRIINDGINFYSYGGYLEGPPELPDEENDHGIPIQNLPLQKTLFNELWSFNLSDNKWRLHPTTGEAPTELASFSAVRHGHFFVVFGGTGIPFGSAASNRMHVCDLRTKVWKLFETTGSPPPPQYGQAVLMDANYFYSVGGTTGYTYSIDVHRLDLKTRVWEALYVSVGNEYVDPEKRYRHELAFDGSLMYVLAGGTANSSNKLENIPAFNIENNTWYLVKTSGTLGIPPPRKCQGIVQQDDNVYMCGGCDNLRIHMDMWKLNLKDRVWTRIPVVMPSALYFHGFTITDAGCLYVFGGVSSIEQNARTNRVYRIWIKIPSLRELAWDTLLANYPELKVSNRLTLRTIGIPPEFAERVIEPKGKERKGKLYEAVRRLFP